MRKARNNNNFIDKTFTIIAYVILRVFPASQQEKKDLLEVIQMKKKLQELMIKLLYKTTEPKPKLILTMLMRI